MNQKKVIVETREIIVWVYLAFLVFLFLMLSPINCFANGRRATDSSVFGYIALAMSKGQMPYKDAFDHKGPLIYIYNYLGMQISYYRGVWVIEYISLLVYLGLVYKTARLFCSRGVSCILSFIVLMSMVDFFQGGNLVEEYALPYVAFALYIFTDYFLHHKIGKVRLMICGFCFGAVCLLRVNMIAVWLCFAPAVVIYNWKTDKKIIFYFLKWFVAGFAVITLPIFIWLVQGGAFGAFVRDYIVFNLQYSSNGGMTDTGMFGRLQSAMYFLNYEMMLIVFAAAGYLCTRKKDILFHVTYFICIIMTFLLMGMAGTSYGHYGMMIFPCFVYPLARLDNLWHEEGRMESGAVLLEIWLLVIAIPLSMTCVNRLFEDMNAREEGVVTASGLEDIISLIEENTLPEEKIIVLGNFDIVYILSNRLSASRYSYQTPIFSVNPEFQEEFVKEMDDDPPKIIVETDPGYKAYLEKNNYSVLYSGDDSGYDIVLWMRQ